MAQTATQSFFVAPFAFNGEFLGVEAWQLSVLSPRWLSFAREVLDAYGVTFDRPLPPPFERIGLQFTLGQGAALATFSLDGVPVASSAYLGGEDRIAERELLLMFVESLRLVNAVRQSQTNSRPFAEALDVSERPLHVVVAWGSLAGPDSEMIAQLMTHFAGAFFFGQDA